MNFGSNLELADSNQALVCNLSHPYSKCNFLEFLLTGILYFLLIAVCIILLFWQRKSIKRVFDLINIFWIVMSFWALYHGIFQIFYFDWASKSRYYYLFYVYLDYLLFLLPSCIFVYIISETLYIYRNPGKLIIIFTRLLFGMFFFIFLLLGIIAVFYQKINETRPTQYDFFYLWSSCIDLLLFVFVSIPSFKLIRAITMPVIQPEDVHCVKESKIGLFILDFIFLTRFISNLLSFSGSNYFSNFLSDRIKEANKTNSLLTPKNRYFYVLFDILFNLFTSIILIRGVYVLRRHDLTFVEDPFYTNEKTETETT